MNWFTICNICLFVTSTALLALAYARPVSDAVCTRQLFSYSPALEAVEYHEEDYKGVFHQPSIYRGRPTDEIDEHWRKLWDYGGFNVPYDKLYLLNRSTETPWQRTPEEFGGGATAMLWGFHQLHCLDLVRQGVYRHVYEEKGKVIPAFDGPEYLVLMHIDHCIELMRIHMQCHIDTTPYLVKIDDSVPVGYKAEFSSHHKCRNYEKVRNWVIDHTAIP
ncbi:uncharacterized protein CC84DRAFT_1083597 [Paraphaeosphaeria sporulosa]|uniref:Tat pathway signal sequence n=1 Tax=Paraphaeosphaeria sporulosa TaxID=1460663 RepID=A0A177CPX0_9PLEO|nr:uncharacterized protein CC84DRAFT_1083597 [Paraphaeosphaeria sporulosa]OAG09271.1 hypothetical protein CC84DRAFT_1083597 [Paraphaeosphaeria sporulosa]